MSSNDLKNIAIAQLVFFLVTCPSIIYCMWRHGRRMCLGWLFISIFATIRIVGAALTVGQDGPPSKAVQIISSIAISPLLIGTAGIMHESFHTIKSRHPYIFGWVAQAIIHVHVVAMMALIIIGTLAAVDITQTASKQSTGRNELIAGLFIFLGFCLALVGMMILSYSYARRARGEKWLAGACSISLLFLMARVIYPLICALENSSSWNFISGGPLGARIGLSLVPEFIITIVLVGAGIASRNIMQEDVRMTHIEAQKLMATRVEGASWS